MAPPTHATASALSCDREKGHVAQVLYLLYEPFTLRPQNSGLYPPAKLDTLEPAAAIPLGWFAHATQENERLTAIARGFAVPSAHAL
eukprot:6263257-Prymnesium_polylepis.2